MEWNSRLFWTGAGIGAVQLLIYLICATPYRKTVILGPAWTSQDERTYDKDASVLTLYRSDDQGGVVCPPRIATALKGGDTVHITHNVFEFFGSWDAAPSFTVYRVGWRVSFNCHVVSFVAIVGSLLIPTLVLMLIAMERQVGFLPSR